ncbi:unnamed protein product [Diatraea saccharalis]|uniref:Uncharacterized protein n=1 Tax=Diatraea saccharalis TaxID=40085 RepID=A0A9N9QXY8_9NEOP|nr:unnamed protein product [Diatraea saccharalis]
MAFQRKHSKRKSIQYSDPGKILDLVMNLNDDTCAQSQIKINAYVRLLYNKLYCVKILIAFILAFLTFILCFQLAEECDAELVLLIIINGDRMEAYIEAVGTTVLLRKRKIDVRFFRKINFKLSR